LLALDRDIGLGLGTSTTKRLLGQTVTVGVNKNLKFRASGKGVSF